ncbi:hypothetical protein HED60_14195 [Planctomycetales bacterium ZRK34]|nr:hypothetical protein HED60_14195 [Planctomycetales bacterium ZRK34]
MFYRGRIIAAILVLFSIVTLCGAQTLEPLSVQQVGVGGEIGRRIDVTINNNLLALDADRDFLPPFVERKKSSGYIGLGKLIDAAVRLAAYSRNPDALALKNHLVDFVIQNQTEDGYVGMLAEPQRIKGLWDIHEVGYLVWGLVADYELFNSQRSLDAARKAADYVITRWSQVPEDWSQKTGVATHVAVTGLERAMLALYRATGQHRYLDFVTQTRRLPQWDLPIVIGRRRLIEGHIYAYAARSLAQLELARMTDAPDLPAPAGRMIDFMTGGDGMMITGATGQWEIWTDDQDGRGELGETCATCYQIRVCDALLRKTTDSRFGDLIERMIYNTLFAAQSPDGRKLRYFAPTQGPRVYFDGDTYCCPCNYRRIVSELPTFVYYRSDDPAALAVNLYTESTATLPVAEVPVTVKQTTDYPSSGRVKIQVDPEKPVAFVMRLRIPLWADGVKVLVNEAPIDGPIMPGRFLPIKRQWRAGDVIAIDMAMPWRLVKGRQRQAGRAAVMRGPMVFCLNPSQHPNLNKQDGADLERLLIDPSSLKLVADDSVRPGGMGCRVGMWRSSFGLGGKPDYELTLSEFADPGGRATYFRLREPGMAVDDGLLTTPMLTPRRQ